MKSYILLRANKELGPYLFDELTTQHLYNKDLVWIEGESTSWRLASEIDELKGAVKELPEEKISIPKRAANPDHAAAFTSADTPEKISQTAKFIHTPAVQITPDDQLFSLADPEEQPNRKNPLKKGKGAFSINQDFISLILLLAGAMAGAFIIKQMVDNFDDRQPTVVEAKEIENVNIPASTTSHAAQSITGVSAGETVLNTPQMKNDSFVRVIKTSKALPAPAHKADTGNYKTLVKQELKPVAANTTITANAEKLPKTGEEEKKSTPDVPKQKIGSGSIDISANDYKVGLLGGISGLELSVTNSSGETAENVVIEVEFLKPNGSVAKSEMVQAQNISPGTSKKVAVPSSSRGVKVRYRLVSTNAKEAAVPTDNM